MIRAALVFSLVFALPLSTLADEKDAKALAQEILDKGSALFDMHDATVMAATFTTDARVAWIDRDKDSGELKFSYKDGRAEIEALYRDLFKDASGKTTSKNIVEFARLLAPDVLTIQGTFQPDTSKEGKYPFIQVRTKQGDKWLVKRLQIFIIPQE